MGWAERSGEPIQEDSIMPVMAEAPRKAHVLVDQDVPETRNPSPREIQMLLLQEWRRECADPRQRNAYPVVGLLLNEGLVWANSGDQRSRGGTGLCAGRWRDAAGKRRSRQYQNAIRSDYHSALVEGTKDRASYSSNKESRFGRGRISRIALKWGAKNGVYSCDPEG